MDTHTELGQIEQSLDLAFGALLEGNAPEVHAQLTQLLERGQGLDLERLHTSVDRERVRTMAQKLQFLREGLARQQNQNSLLLQLLVPAVQQPTYGGGAEGAAIPGSPYAANLRPSGRMTQRLQA